MKNKFIIIAVLFVTAFLMQSCGNSNNSSAKTEMDSSMNHQMQNDSMNAGEMQMGNSMMQIMNNTMAKVNSMKMSGDFDLALPI
jgi:ABC-type oligopeptide transport system substrate-binding subunit